MERFPLIRDSSGDVQLEALYRDIVANGFGDTVPTNWFTSQASRPDILAVTWPLLKAILVGGRLPASLKQMIAMTLSRQNDCRYCETAHTGALQSMGVPDEVIRSAAEDPEMREVPPTQRAVLAFALKVARQPNSITDADHQALRDEGFSDPEILEVIMVVALNSFLNIWADASGIPLDSTP